MNIIFFSSEFPPGPGGIGAHAYNLTSQFVSKGNSVSVYAPDRLGYSSKTFDKEQKFEIFRYPVKLSTAKRLKHLAIFLLKQKNCDWIILSGLTNLVLYTVIRLFVKARVLCVVHGHEVIMAKGLSRLLVRRTLVKADHVVAVSDFSKGLLYENNISRPVITIPNGVNLAEGLKPKNKNKDKLILITVGSVTQRKGQHNVVSALPAIISRFDKVEYHIVGIPKEKDAVELLALKLGVTNSVFFHGALTDEERNAYLAQADIFMMLSENLSDGDVEGFGIAVLEANGFGLPAIGSKGTGVEQAIHSSVSGYLVDAHNPEEICDSISSLMDKYEQFSRQSIAWAYDHEWSKIGDKYYNILKGK